MATNLAIDDNLIDEARRIGGHSTKREAVTVALQEYVQRRKQLAILDLFGTIDIDDSYSARRSRALDRIEVEGESPRR
jgi:Arc/MetJ family transcription regulator